MQKCSKCGETKSLDQFYWRSDKRRPYLHCKKCQNIYGQEHYQRNKKDYLQRAAEKAERNREWLRNIKTKLCCTYCGENHPACLDFHHISGDKKFNISSAGVRGAKRQNVLDEIAKCIVLCSNCHRKLHYTEQKRVT